MVEARRSKLGAREGDCISDLKQFQVEGEGSQRAFSILHLLRRVALLLNSHCLARA
jgi:hypothetical protein